MFLEHPGGRLDLAAPVVMGVLNVTPDSFSDGGRYAEPAAAIAQGLKLVEEGAAILDIGGESTRPGALAVPAEEQLRRVLPVILALRERTGALISIDTSEPAVIRGAAAAGAVLVNDVRGLLRPGALEAVAETGLAACLMHMQGDPATMQEAPAYSDVLAQVRTFLAARVAACEALGIPRERLCLDPGFGFGKRTEHNLSLLMGLPSLARLGLPMLVGLSRKSILQALTGRPVGGRLAGSIALATLAAWRGARIIRAHDVAATRDAMCVVAALQAAAPPGQ
jgi:dihydropteroate synthase